MGSGRKSNPGEWVGGLTSLPAFVDGEGGPYRPEALFWLDADGLVRGFSTGKPGGMLAAACTSLREAMESSSVGRPQVPDRLRVASAELAEVLRQGVPGIDIMVAPTPELDAMLDAMRENLSEHMEDEESYLPPGVAPEAVGALFRAAAALYRAKPWKRVPSDTDLISVSIEALGVMGAALSVIGQMDESLGMILFSGIEDFEAYLDAAEALEYGEEPMMPRHLALHFERGADLGAAPRKEVAEHRWELAEAGAYPRITVVEEGMVARSPTAAEIGLVEAIALALPGFLEQKKALRAAWDGAKPFARAASAACHAGVVEVLLRVPCDDARREPRRPDGLLGGLFDLEEDLDGLEGEARGKLEDELLRHFLASPEGTGRADAESCRLLMRVAADQFGITVASLRAAVLREILFDIFPRQVSIEATAAQGIVEECRAFFAFLGRAYGFEQAEACRRVLGDHAAQRLAEELADEGNYGMAKSLLMSGLREGGELDSPEAVEAWLREFEASPLASSFHLPGDGAWARPQPKGAARAKKKARKAARKARKKNR